MEKAYKTVFKYGEDEVIINKSRFIGYSMPIETEEDALEFVEKIKEQNRDATHNVFAYVVGESSNIQRFNDDGEPSGTAGIPSLEVIKKEELRNVVVVVTRYFGGIKLGAGGLIRAYTKAAKIGIEAGKIVDMIPHVKLKVTIDYTAYGKIENYLINSKYILDDTVFDEKVNIYVYVNTSDIDDFNKEIMNLTSGDVEIEEIGIEYVAMRESKKII